jgi:hypothetical protein
VFDRVKSRCNWGYDVMRKVHFCLITLFWSRFVINFQWFSMILRGILILDDHRKLLGGDGIPSVWTEDAEKALGIQVIDFPPAKSTFWTRTEENTFVQKSSRDYIERIPNYTLKRRIQFVTRHSVGLKMSYVGLKMRGVRLHVFNLLSGCRILFVPDTIRT